MLRRCLLPFRDFQNTCPVLASELRGSKDEGGLLPQEINFLGRRVELLKVWKKRNGRIKDTSQKTNVAML